MKADVAVVGGGIVGAAIAAELSSKGADVVLIEKERRLAAHQSGHNSGVIHSGIYYKPGSLKAKLCVQGAQRMKEYCRENGIPMRQVGKIIVATDESELPRLEDIFRRGSANSVPGIEMIGPERIREIEPHAVGIKAIHLPEVCITDYAAVTRSLARRIPRVLTGVQARSIREGRVETTEGPVEAGRIVACAGLHADRLVRTPVRIIPFRGEYWLLRRDLVRGLIYPVPDPAMPFLGVHFTRRVDGTVDAGPNAVLALRREGYTWRHFDGADMLSVAGYSGFWKMARRLGWIGVQEVYRSLSKSKFVRDLQKLVPEVTEHDLAPGGSGVRAQAVDPEGKLVDDFSIVRRGSVVHVVNAPSPAATASLAIARHVLESAGW